MTKDIVKNGDICWFDSNGNSIVIAENGGVYFVDKYDKVRYLTDDIRKIYDEKTENYSIDGVDIDEYIKSINQPAETTSVWTTAAKAAEPVVTSKPLQETNAATSETVTEVPARVIYQTIYNAPEAEKTEVSKIEKSEKEETERDEFSTVTTVPEEYESEEFQSGSEVYSEAAVTEIPQEKILYFTENAVNESTSEIAESTETTSFAVTENTEENVSATNNAQAFLLLAGVFGAAVAAAVFMRKIKKKNISEDADLSELSARERDEIRLNKQKRKKPKKQKIKKKRVVPKTMQKTLPYKRVCDNYIFKMEENRYSKTYRFEDINYSIAKQEEQEGIFLGYCSVLNSFDTSADIQVTVHNNRVNKEKFNEMVLLKHKGDDFDRYVDVYNDMLVEKMEQGQNGIIRNKYLKYTVENRKIETDYDKAVVDAAKKILAEYGAEIEKSPLEKIIEKAESAGVPVEIISEKKAVFMDVRDETFIAVEQVDEGISYSVYTSDLTLVDGGVWEMYEGMDLRSAAADLLATMEKNIADVPDYDNFIELASGNSDKNISEELAKIKSDIYAKLSSENQNISAEKSEKGVIMSNCTVDNYGRIFVFSGCNNNSKETNVYFNLRDLGSFAQNNNYYFTNVIESLPNGITSSNIITAFEKNGEDSFSVMRNPFDNDIQSGIFCVVRNNLYVFQYLNEMGFEITKVSLEDFGMEKIFGQSIFEESAFLGLKKQNDVVLDKTVLRFFTDEKNLFLITTDNELYQGDMSLNNLECIISDGIYQNNLVFDGNTIYYVNFNLELRGYNLSTCKNTLVSGEFVRAVALDNENLIYSNKEGIFSLNLLNNKLKKLSNLKADAISCSNGKIVYLKNDMLYLLEDNNSKEIYNGRLLYFGCLSDGKSVFCRNIGKEGYNDFMIDIDN